MASRVGRGIALPFLDRGIRRGWVVSSTPQPHFTPGKTRYPLYRKLGGPQGQSGRAENLAPPGFDPRTVQPVAQSLYRLSYLAHRGKAISMTYSECVIVTLIIQRTKSMHRNKFVIFHVVSYKAWFSAKIIEHKMCVLRFASTLSEIFLILRRNQQDIIMNYIDFHVKYPLFLSDFN
jgi:hypothetical protein